MNWTKSKIFPWSLKRKLFGSDLSVRNLTQIAEIHFSLHQWNERLPGRETLKQLQRHHLGFTSQELVGIATRVVVTS